MNDGVTPEIFDEIRNIFNKWDLPRRRAMADIISDTHYSRICGMIQVKGKCQKVIKLEKYKKIIDEMYEDDKRAREIAGLILPEIECQGDGYGIPAISDVMKAIVNKK